ncbi:hypothetical protein KAW18_01415 [candidate division WOR-3 bacterium]|nr:hypothetical protein [candidate division WOR-3 bacterium]
MKKLCECGCGGYASPGRRFIQGHYILTEEIKRKRNETRKINKEIKEGKRLPPELPFCKCGCGGRVSRKGSKYIAGHQNRGRVAWNKGLTKENDDRVKKQGETYKERYVNGEIDEVWCKGKTKETDPGLMQVSESLLSFYQTEEGIKLKEQKNEKYSGEGNPFYGKNQTEETIEKIKKTLSVMDTKGEANHFFGHKHTDESKQIISKKKIVFYQTEEGKLLLKEQGLKRSKRMLENWQDPEFIKMMSKAKKEYYQTEKGIKHRQNLREIIIENLKKGVYNRKPTQPEKDTDSIVQNLIPNEYKYNGNYDLGISIGGKIPDFVNVNGKKKAIDLFGDYWHEGEDPQIRIDLFKKCGWDLLVIWEHELKNRDTMIQKILKFHGKESDYVIPQKILDRWVDSEKKEGER